MLKVVRIFVVVSGISLGDASHQPQHTLSVVMSWCVYMLAWSQFSSPPNTSEVSRLRCFKHPWEPIIQSAWYNDGKHFITFVSVSYWYRSSPFHKKRSSKTCKLSKTTRGLNIYLHFLRWSLNIFWQHTLCSYGVVSVVRRLCGRHRGYYMAARGYEFYLECWKYLSRVRFAHSWEILSAREDKIRIPKRPCNVLFIL